MLDVRSLTVELPSAEGWVRPVNEISLRIAAGEALGLVGESGSGKTMLSLALMGLLPPGARTSGEAWLAREEKFADEMKEKSAAESESPSRKNLVRLTEREWRQVRGGEIAMVFQEPMTSLKSGDARWRPD